MGHGDNSAIGSIKSCDFLFIVKQFVLDTANANIKNDGNNLQIQNFCRCTRKAWLARLFISKFV